MNAWTTGTAALLLLALGGCATLNGPEAYANAKAQQTQCKVVTLSSASQELRLQNEKGTGNDAMQQTEGRLDVGHVQLNEPRILSNPVAPGESILTQVRRNC
ncbi:MAG TPA: hypothetical protein VLU54_18030 [Casimicrobiaceae bacterium]|nr:hypothetical protein [Casimicrobiaceae bacterium]